jgi:Cys-rich repeat protein
MWKPMTTLRALTALSLGLGMSVAIPSCSDDSSDGAGNSSITCTLAGNRCEFDCTKDLGCVECLTNNDCEPGSPVCVLGTCSACATNSDCATGQVCEPATHQCAAPCTTNADCRPNAPLCDTASGACVGCLAATDCPAAAPLCDATRKQCSQCTSRADCGVAAPACNLQTGQCEECLVDTDCNGSGACGQDHQCHPLCKTNDDCAGVTGEQEFPGEGPLCNLTTGACVECLSPTDCTDPAQPLCNEQFRCVACTTNADCPVATPICATLRFGQGGGQNNTQCVACESNADCTDPTLPTCNEAGVCVAGG